MEASVSFCPEEVNQEINRPYLKDRIDTEEYDAMYKEVRDRIRSILKETDEKKYNIAEKLFNFNSAIDLFDFSKDEDLLLELLKRGSLAFRNIVQKQKITDEFIMSYLEHGEKLGYEKRYLTQIFFESLRYHDMAEENAAKCIKNFIVEGFFNPLFERLINGLKIDSEEIESMVPLIMKMPEDYLDNFLKALKKINQEDLYDQVLFISLKNRQLSEDFINRYLQDFKKYNLYKPLVGNQKIDLDLFSNLLDSAPLEQYTILYKYLENDLTEYNAELEEKIIEGSNLDKDSITRCYRYLLQRKNSPNSLDFIKKCESYFTLGKIFTLLCYLGYQKNFDFIPEDYIADYYRRHSEEFIENALIYNKSFSEEFLLEFLGRYSVEKVLEYQKLTTSFVKHLINNNFWDVDSIYRLNDNRNIDDAWKESDEELSLMFKMIEEKKYILSCAEDEKEK